MNNLISSQKKKKFTVSSALTVVSLILFTVFIFLVDKGVILGTYEARIIRLCGIYSIAALSMNLVNGFTGQFSLGQAGFMAIGAYVTSILIIPPSSKAAMYYVEPIAPWVEKLHAPFFPALMIGGLFAAAAAFLIGFPVLRLRGDYLAIASLGFSEIIRIFITNIIPITNGALGLKNIPATADIWWTTLAAAAVVLFMLRLMKTSYGRAFKAIRDDEIAASAMGISLFKHKMISFIIGGFLAGVSGGLIASVVGAITPIYFRFTLAYEILLIVVLGGQGSITGSVVGAVILTFSREWLRFLDAGFSIGPIKVPEIAGMRMLVFSVLLMVIILFYRKGLFGTNEFSWKGLSNVLKSVVSKVRLLFSGKPKKAGGGK